MSWADEQNKKDREAQESQRTNDALRLSEQRLKDEVGKECFETVKAYVKTEVEKYAKHNPAIKLAFYPDTSYGEESDIMSQIPSFSIVNQSGPNLRIYVKYSKARHALLWECNGSKSIYELRVHANGEGYFVGRDGQPKTPQQIGDEILNIIRNA